MQKRFNVRVYGILVQDGKLLVSDEYIKGYEITKLPGGGLEFGEGTADCLIREFKEEADITIKIKRHFYTTDFFVTSAFSTNSQVLSIYYVVSHSGKIKLEVSDKKFDFKKRINGAQSFRWIDVNTISENDFTLPIDKIVGKLLNDKYK